VPSETLVWGPTYYWTAYVTDNITPVVGSSVRTFTTEHRRHRTDPGVTRARRRPRRPHPDVHRQRHEHGRPTEPPPVRVRDLHSRPWGGPQDPLPVDGGRRHHVDGPARVPAERHDLHVARPRPGRHHD
jgi:hypothetical protein